MKFLKQVGAAAVALAMLAATAIPAAADESYMKLLTVPVSDVLGTEELYMNAGIGICASEDNNFVRFTESNLEKWRESGEISYSEILLDSDLQNKGLVNFIGYEFNTEDDYAQFGLRDENGNISQRMVVKYNKENNSLETVSKYDEWCSVTEDGYVFTGNWENDILLAKITSPDGTENIAEFKLGGIDGNYFFSAMSNARNSDKYIAYVLLAVSVTNDEEMTASEGFTINDYDLEAYGIDKDGNAEQIFKETHNFWGADSSGDNYFLFHTMTLPVAAKSRIYLSDTDEIIDLTSLDDATHLYVYDGDGFGSAQICSLGNKIYGTKAIAYAQPGNKVNDNWFGTYALIDIKTGKKIGDYEYMKEMSTEDGEIYRIKTADDKWGFMNSKGKVLITYDDAGSFVGDYAPVVKDGKAFLIDRSMKRVSEKIDADSVLTLSDDLFHIVKDDEEYFMTFSVETPEAYTAEPTEELVEEPAEPTEEPVEEPAETESPETPAEPAPAESAPTTSGTTSAAANKGNPDTGVAIAFIPLLIAGAGTAMLTRKRK